MTDRFDWRFILVRDIRHPNYATNSKEYVDWTKRDGERLEKLAIAREKLYKEAESLLQSSDSSVRELALFYVEFFKAR